MESANRRLTPEERLQGFLRHCQLMMALHRAGQEARSDKRHSLLALTDQFGNRVDLLAGLRGLEDSAFSRAIDVAFEGQSLRVVGREYHLEKLLEKRPSP